MMKHDNVTGRALFLFAFFCMAGFLVPCGCRKEQRMSEPEAIAAFKKYVLSPIPASVTDIRADQPKKFGGYSYTFRFKLNRDDLTLITSSVPFVRVWNVKYKNGHLSWQWNRDGLFGTGPGSGIQCYGAHTREPDWFRPGGWPDPEAHAFWKEGNFVNVEAIDKHSGPTNIKVLLYNEKAAESYFYVYYSEK